MLRQVGVNRWVEAGDTRGVETREEKPARLADRGTFLLHLLEEVFDGVLECIDCELAGKCGGGVGDGLLAT